MQRRSLGDTNLTGHVTPRAHGLVGGKLRPEAINRNGSWHSAADAGSGSEDGVETGRIAIVANVKVHVSAVRGIVLGKRAGRAEHQQSPAHNEQTAAHKDQASVFHCTSVKVKMSAAAIRIGSHSISAVAPSMKHAHVAQ